jgi:hypothetical protein
MTDLAIEVPRRRPRFSRADLPPAFQLSERDVQICDNNGHRFLSFGIVLSEPVYGTAACCRRYLQDTRFNRHFRPYASHTKEVGP